MKTTKAQVVKKKGNRICVYISRLSEEDNECFWIMIPSHYPKWFIEGSPCFCKLKDNIKTGEQFIEDPNALCEFEYKERLSDEEFNKRINNY